MIATMIIVLVMARAMAAVHMGASDCLAIHNVVSTSRGRASDRHPSNSHDYHDRLSVILLTGLA